MFRLWGALRGKALAVGCLLLLLPGAVWAQSAADQQELLEAFNKAQVLEKDGKTQAAIEQWERVVELAPRVFGPDDEATASAMNRLATLCYQMGQYARAEPLFQRSLQIHEDKLGKDHPKVATELCNLAVLYQAMGQHARAEPLFQRSLQIREDKLGKDHPDVANSLNNLATLYQDMGQYAKAEPLFRRSLQINEDKLGRDHPDVARILNNLASLSRDMGQYARAEPLFQRSLQIREDKLGKDHPAVANSLNNLALLYKEMGQYARAEPLFQRSLQIREDKLGKDHPAVATSLNNLAGLYRDMGQYARAEPLFQRSLQICEDKLGKDHPDVANSLNNLARLYQDMGQYAKAEPLSQRSLQIREDKLGKDHPSVATSLNSLALLDAAGERWDEASQATDRARHILRRHASRVLPVLSEGEQLTFLANTQEKDLHMALSLGLLRSHDAETVARSAAWLLNGKALAQESLAERALLARDCGDPRLADLSQQLLDTRRQLATLTLAPSRANQEDSRRQRLQQLTDQEQDLSKRLAQARGSLAQEDPWVELSAVRKALPTDAVLIDIARFNVASFQEMKWQPAHYAAWVIPPPDKGKVQLIDLGPADRIDAAVRAVRDALRAAQGGREHPSTIRELGEPDAEQQLRQPLAALAELVLRPLAEHLDGTEHWILSPDASLWLVPWAALPLKDGSYVIEKHQISYLVSGRDLLTPPSPSKSGRSMILADPDYDLGLEKARSETEDLVARSGSLAELRGLTASLQLPRVPRLPGTAVEAQAVAPKLQRYVQREPWLFTDKQALEGVVKAVHHPQVLMLSTHGYFLEDQEVTPAERAGLETKTPALTKEGKPLENPLLRCGLLLAGCNNRSQAKEGDEDGVLTGLEIIGTDLRGTELVVLSACETGLGEVRNGEGVAGLRQAFQLAGAHSVVATLWQIPDRDSARLMSDFFGNLAEGQGEAEALRNAQLKLIQNHRDRKGAAHPFFWAAFTLTGP